MQNQTRNFGVIASALLLSLAAGCSSESEESGREDALDAPITRSVFIQIEEGEWDYAPTGMQMIANRPFDADESVFVGAGPDRNGSVYQKARYIEYTDAEFTEKAAIAPEWEHLGIVGPTIRAAVGDRLEVTVKNAGSRPYSFHPHGVFYDPDSEGVAPISPGETVVYEWQVPERAGPGPNDPSSLVWLYHSHANSVADTNAGLVGPIIITARDMADADARPIDVDREFVTLFTVHDENSSALFEDNLAGLEQEVDPENEDFIESNLMHSMNGFVYGNGPMPTMQVGEHVRWYLLAMGTEVDLHTPHWHGATVLENGHRTDVVELLPASMKTVDMIPDSPGTWPYHCHVNDHIEAGMVGRFRVDP